MAFQSTVNPAQLTQLGQANLAGDKRALYLKLFSGEMFKGFQNNKERQIIAVHLHWSYQV
jgi:hypothetical protein